MPQRREQRERRRHRGSHQYYDEKRGKHTLGKVLAVIQLLISVIFVGILFNSGMIPMKYLAAGAAVLFVLFALTFGLQFAKSKSYRSDTEYSDQRRVGVWNLLLYEYAQGNQ